jgi:hypothetical protein
MAFSLFKQHVNQLSRKRTANIEELMKTKNAKYFSLTPYDGTEKYFAF